MEHTRVHLRTCQRAKKYKCCNLGQMVCVSAVVARTSPQPDWSPPPPNRADASPLGMDRSYGIMVNYRYDLNRLYDNNRNYLLQHKVRAAGLGGMRVCDPGQLSA